MKLQELLMKLKSILLIDEQLKAYLYNNKIEIIDFTSGYKIPEKNIEVDDFYGSAINLNLNNKNIITSIDDFMFRSLFTMANKEMIIELINLIGTEIEDYNSYGKLPSFKDQPCITI